MYLHILTLSALTSFVAAAAAATTIKAVVVLGGTAGVNGAIVFEQNPNVSQVRISGRIQGLTPNALRGLHVHEFGNLTDGCLSTGAHYNPLGKNHGSPTDWPNRHVGDLGNVQADASGVATIDFTDPGISLTGQYMIIGRALVVHNGTDDLGKGSTPDSLTTGNSGGRSACGVIGYARVNSSAY